MRLSTASWLCVALFACRRESAQEAPAPTRITIATSQEPDVLLPAYAETGGAHQVIEAGARYLTTYDASWALVPSLAEEIPSVENGAVELLDAAGQPVKNPQAARRMRVTWKLQPGAKWEDGKPVTADDFVFAHDVMLDSTQEVRDRTIVEKVERMEAKDAQTLVVHWKEPYAFHAVYRNHHVLPRHIVEPLWRADAGGTTNLKTSRIARAPLFFGPFRLLEWKPGEFLRMTRNAHAWKRPIIDEVVWRFIPKDIAAVASLESGAVDAIAPDGTIGVDLALDLQARQPKLVDVTFQPGMVWAHIDVNLDDAWLSQKKMRQALLHAIDRAAAIKTVFRGRYDVAPGLFPARHDGHSDALPRYAHDPAKARELLESLGWKTGAGGIRVNDKGERLSLQIAYATGQKTSEDLLQIFASNLAGVGIELKPVGMTPKVFFGDALMHRKVAHLAFYAWTLDPAAYAETMLGSDRIPTEKNGWAGQNYPGYRNPDVDALLVRIPRELGVAERRKLLQQLNAIFMDDLPMLPVYTRPVVSVTRKGLKGWAPTGTQAPVSWNIETWTLP